ncbi:MAG: dihydroorotate dehydrogenase [Vannielia sp.]|uniref:dihydroorotate dehydrogenase n=1 Tax=Vannielia sp. TaxID=2813045 RepID=UPI003B8CA07F
MADHDDKLTASEEALLESFFSAARVEEPMAAEPSPELLARVLEDGYGVQEGFAEAAPVIASAGAAAAPRRSFLAALWASIGGAPGLAGLTAAALAGIWIGLRPPEAVSSVTASLLGSATTAADTTASDDDLLGYDVAYADLLTDG